MKSPKCLPAYLAVLLSLPAIAQTAAPAAAAASPNQPASAASKPTAALQANYGKLPLSFEANQGQADPQARFTARGQGYSLYLTDSAAVLALTKPEKPKPAAPPKPAAASGEQPTRVPQVREANLGSSTPKTDLIRMELAGANPNLRPAGADALPGKANYFLGNDPAKWHSNVPTYAKVKYSAVYPGVDLLYYGNQSQLEYDFVVAPNADPAPVKLRFAGANKLKLDPNGDLTVLAKHGQIAFHKPVVYQTTKEGRRQPIEGSFALLANNTVAFRLGPYDRDRELIIDPVLAYSTYLGGNSQNDLGFAIAADASGYAYIAGRTYSVNFPTTAGAYQTLNKGGENGTSFVTKLSRDGSTLVYSTFLGGSGGDAATGLAIDAAGEAFVFGTTSSRDFPVTNGAFQTANHAANNGPNLFIARLNSTGSSLVYSTYLGGSYFDYSAGMAVDRSGDAFVTGFTGDKDFPVTPGAFQPKRKGPLGGENFFVSELAPGGSSLVYSTYLGGSSNEFCFDRGSAIAVDDLGLAYVTGTACTANFPTTPGAFQTAPKAPNTYNAVVTKINSTGTALVYSTFLDGSNGSGGSAIAVDAEGNAYVAGGTTSTDFPTTPGAYSVANNTSFGTGFVTKLNPIGSGLVYSTYYTGLGNTDPSAIALDPAGDAYLAGSPTLAELNAAGSGLPYSGSLAGVFQALGVALDGLGNSYLTGQAYFGLATTPGALQTSDPSPSGYSSFVAKYASTGGTITTLASNSNPQGIGENVAFTAHVAPAVGNAVPTGTVRFVIDEVDVEDVPLDSGGNAYYSTASLASGTHPVVAIYLGDPGVSLPSRGLVAETIAAQAAAPTFVPLGGTYTGYMEVKLETATKGADIYYTTDNSTPTTSSTEYAGVIALDATTTINAIAAAPGLANSPVSTQTYTFIPTAIATTTSIKSSLNPSSSGQPVTFTATVAPASGPTPTGTVTFKHGSIVFGSAPLVGGVAQLTTSSLAPGGYDFVAVYSGSETNAKSYSPTLLQGVNP